jgi:hypothetical protein
MVRVLVLSAVWCACVSASQAPTPNPLPLSPSTSVFRRPHVPRTASLSLSSRETIARWGGLRWKVFCVTAVLLGWLDRLPQPMWPPNADPSFDQKTPTRTTVTHTDLPTTHSLPIPTTLHPLRGAQHVDLMTTVALLAGSVEQCPRSIGRCRGRPKWRLTRLLEILVIRA